MRKRPLLLVLIFGFAIVSLTASAQQISAPNEWIWMGGSSTLNCTVFYGSPIGDITNCFHAGAYGTLGSPAAENIPSSRDHAATWTDNSGNFWLFGGYAYDPDTTYCIDFDYCTLNDLWKYSPSSNQWIWMSGSSRATQTGSYGTLGVPAAGNVPTGRAGAAHWTDENGNLWLFGGISQYSGNNGFADLNDLWKFNPSTNQWTWMGGSSSPVCGSDGRCGRPGVYGKQATPDPANIPGSRSDPASWTDNRGNLWLFGGLGEDANGSYGFLNDLWEFSPLANEWTWVTGSNTKESDGACSTLGTPTTGDSPGSLSGAATWVDKNGDFWLYGGLNGVSGPMAFVHLVTDALWRFNASSTEWTWMGGNCAAISVGGSGSLVLGTLGTAAPGNSPGVLEGASGWTDSSGNLWLLAGRLWKFNPSTAQWAWMGGIDETAQSGVYGILGTPAPGNVPGNRSYSASWSDTGGNLWAFGGGDSPSGGVYESYNDLWKYQPSSDPLPVATTPVIDLGSGTYTQAQTVTIKDATNGATIYYTTDGTTPTTNSKVYSAPVVITSSETLKAIATASGCFPSAVAVATYTMASPAAAPTLSPAAGTYTTTQSVTISDSTPGATIYYTLDGSIPTASSTQYTSAITVSSTETITAMATATGYSASAVATATYIIPPDFSVASSPASLAVTGGQSATASVSVTPLHGFNSLLSFTCSGLPAGASCSFSPQFTSQSSGTITTTLTVNTSKLTATLRHDSNPLLPGSVLALTLCCLGWRKRRYSQLLLLITVSIAGLSVFTGCGGGSSSAPQPLTSTITVIATAGSVQHTTTISLTVN